MRGIEVSSKTRVMVVGPLDPDSFADNVAHVLRAEGHEVLAAGPVRHDAGRGRVKNLSGLVRTHVQGLDEQAQGHLIRKAQAFKPDLILTMDARLRPAVGQGLRELGARLVLWYPDHVANLGRHELFLVPYDRLYFKNSMLVAQLRDLHGLPAAYLPEAANPAWHRPTVPYGTKREIVVAGNLHPTRSLLLDRLLSDGFPIRIFGNARPTWVDLPRLDAAHNDRHIARHEKAEVFRSARAVLNNLHPAEQIGSNCRLFEATACGALVLTEWRQDMAALFEPGKEVLTFATYDQLASLCTEVLSSAEAGASIADAAAARSSTEHTYFIRLDHILNDLELG